MGVLYLRLIKTFCDNIARVCRGQTVFRLTVVLYLYGLCAFSLFPPFANLSSGLEQEQAAETAKVGVGGGSYPPQQLPEKTASGDQAAAAWPLEMGMQEPEEFSKPQMVLYSSYSIQKGDIIGDLAAGFGLNQDTLISINNIKNTRLIQVGQVLRIPNQDGILYTVKKNDNLETISEKYSADTAAIRLTNELFSDSVSAGTVLFIPGARLDWVERQEINGDLFIWPASGSITSLYGYRRWPFDKGLRQFHTGLDIGAPHGAPIRAAMSGRVSAAGWNDVLGNYVVISHHSGYRTLYGHMSVIRTKSGAYVGTGERIGDVGSTGMSTGAHLHFTVYKNGVTVNPRSLLK